MEELYTLKQIAQLAGVAWQTAQKYKDHLKQFMINLNPIEEGEEHKIRYKKGAVVALRELRDKGVANRQRWFTK